MKKFFEFLGFGSFVLFITWLVVCAFSVKNDTLPSVPGYRTYDLPESTIVCKIEDMFPVNCVIIPRGSLLLVPADSTHDSK